MPPANTQRFLIIADGQFGPMTSKTANCCIRYMPERVVAVFDRGHAGKTVRDVLGFGGTIPVVGDFEQGLRLGATAILVGIAPMGGRLPAEWRDWLRCAIEHGLEIWSGLHTFIGDDPELGTLARQRGVRIFDARKPPLNLPVADGRAAEVDAYVVHTVGSDCNVGKMTAQVELRNVLIERGHRTRFLATGQTGIFIEGWGIAVDAVVADFVAGAAEESDRDLPQHVRPERGAGARRRGPRGGRDGAPRHRSGAVRRDASRGRDRARGSSGPFGVGGRGSAFGCHVGATSP